MKHSDFICLLAFLVCSQGIHAEFGGESETLCEFSAFHDVNLINTIVC